MLYRIAPERETSGNERDHSYVLPNINVREAVVQRRPCNIRERSRERLQRDVGLQEVVHARYARKIVDRVQKAHGSVGVNRVRVIIDCQPF